ncbi:hypothetical protein TEHAL1_19460 [Tetragenococcus halophilus]|nr:hypothetical protein TEHN0098T_1687 [Tetragenococcus halophilus subsp. halophilus]GMA42738.1 hypothetical protein GCM10025853_01940 [Tetragenococcus halophilus subsp. halophilus DSM 20339]GMG62143.1 hypothetical protein TEHAB4_18890 [Tetragenococcus halophilus]GBD65493.1 hypothetical protein TEHN7116_0457 [Tetragenococcus halophilus subsp. halophilus]GBD69744.1 hypothetical protein TEHN7121_0290 [Tetragenococcus halophilus subsp. halophilus]
MFINCLKEGRLNKSTLLFTCAKQTTVKRIFKNKSYFFVKNTKKHYDNIVVRNFKKGDK